MRKEGTVSSIYKRIFTGLLAVALLLSCYPLLRWGMDSYYRAAYPYEYKEYIRTYSAENNLPEALVCAVVYTESTFRPDAVSPVGARGLMQLMEESFDWTRNKLGEGEEVTYDTMFDPETNIRYGSKMLSLLLEEFGSVETALCAYHAGWGNVKNWLKNPDYSSDGRTVDVIPYDDTRYYVNKVKQTAQIYEKLYDLSGR